MDPLHRIKKGPLTIEVTNDRMMIRREPDKNNSLDIDDVMKRMEDEFTRFKRRV